MGPYHIPLRASRNLTGNDTARKVSMVMVGRMASLLHRSQCKILSFGCLARMISTSMLTAE